MSVASPLLYTLDGLMEEQQAVIERDVTVQDKFGNAPKRTWEVVATVPCKFWWWHSTGGRSAAREYGEPERNVNLRGGGLIVPLGTDVTAEDRLAKILNSEGETIIDGGPMRIVSVEQYVGHIELSVWQP